MNNARPHRFPPLAQLLAGPVAPSGASAAEAYQQALEQGYADGMRSGEEAGRTQGQAAGHALGLLQGTEQGRREAVAGLDTLGRPLDQALAALQRMQADYQSALRKEVVELVGKVARQVIRCELALQPMQLLSMVDETLATLPRVGDHEVEIYLHPEDRQRIVDLDPTRAQRWKLLPDARLEPGECHVKAANHEADAGCRQRQAAVMQDISAQLAEPGEDGDAALPSTPAAPAAAPASAAAEAPARKRAPAKTPRRKVTE